MNLKDEFNTSNYNKKLFKYIYIYYKPKIDFLIKKFNLQDYESDLMLKLWEITCNKDFSTFKSKQAIDNYIYISLKNFCSTLYKKSKKSKNTFCDPDKLEYQLNKISSNLYCVLDEQAYSFSDLVSILSEKQKNILMLKFKIGLSDIEISKVLNISRQAVNKNVRKSIFKIKSQLFN